MQKQGFTLVELIVVITILAVLGTIAFVSFQGYAVQARDSTRISDLTVMKKALELYKVQQDSYPSPSETSFNVSYS
jgi:prepilin-type N-terminal cleavage/methylation domain-containing protein